LEETSSTICGAGTFAVGNTPLQKQPLTDAAAAAAVGCYCWRITSHCESCHQPENKNRGGKRRGKKIINNKRQQPKPQLKQPPRLKQKQGQQPWPDA